MHQPTNWPRKQKKLTSNLSRLRWDFIKTSYMKILDIKVLKGPNYWSVRRPKLIQMRLDLEEMEDRPTNKIPGFRERLEKLLPTLIEHRCSEDGRGGFFHRVDEG